MNIIMMIKKIILELKRIFLSSGKHPRGSLFYKVAVLEQMPSEWNFLLTLGIRRK